MPIMTRPWRECSSPESMSRRASTIVLATETTMPTTTPCRYGQPSSAPAPTPRPTESRMPSGPPSSATHFTRSRSAQRELDADREHQQDDADLGEQLEGADVGDGRAGGERADQDAAQDIAQDERLPGQPRERTSEHRGDEHVREIAKDDRVRHHAQVSHPRRDVRNDRGVERGGRVIVAAAPGRARLRCPGKVPGNR